MFSDTALGFPEYLISSLKGLTVGEHHYSTNIKSLQDT